EEIERQRAHERYMRLQEQGKTEQARKDLGNMSKSASEICLPLLDLASFSMVPLEYF
ncbi:UNVERIFIED_CONTAM: hypothetical protein Sindi_2709200, partial [Sesamum indicum]